MDIDDVVVGDVFKGVKLYLIAVNNKFRCDALMSGSGKRDTSGRDIVFLWLGSLQLSTYTVEDVLEKQFQYITNAGDTFHNIQELLEQEDASA